MKQVMVRDWAYGYLTYDEWVEDNFPEELKNFKYNKYPLENRIYNLIGQAPHENYLDRELCLIKDIDTKQVYIIDKRGLKFVKENKMKDKLKVKVWNYKNVVLYEVLEQDEELRGKNEIFKASNGWTIYGKEYPEIFEPNNHIYIKGDEIEKDNIVSICEMETTIEAKQIVREVKQAVKEFNESQKEILDNEEKEYLSAVIKPFRDEVKSITKSKGVKIDTEFICIRLKSNENIFFPYFKKSTMYKGMELNKYYTLEELGL